MKQTTIFSIISGISLGTVVVSGSIAMMTNVSADDLPSIDDNITITVDSACTMGQTVLQSGNTLNPGETSTIGQSRIAAYCNDSEGYAIYAIGYTNSEYGNTNLVSTDGNHTIPTGTPGSNSYWNMKLTQGTATGPTSYLPTMVNEFTTNATIPNDYTKVAYRDSSTISQNQDPTETGSYFTSTYSAHIDTTQPAGIYTGQVQYVMVHPSSAPKPEIPPTYMQDTATIKQKLTKIGSTIQATDIRDGKKYWVARMADGDVWMTQNLDLDIEAGRTYTAEDTDLAYSSIGTTWAPSSEEATRPTDNTSWYRKNAQPESYDPGKLYWNGELSDNWESTLDDMTAISGDAHYHIGNYYNWSAAVAISDTSAYTTSYQDVDQSICPAGWRLPGYGDNKSYQNLINAENPTAGTDGNIQNSRTYFVYGGGWYGRSSKVGYQGSYWTSIASYSYGARIFSFNSNGNITSNGSGYRGDSGISVRCVLR